MSERERGVGEVAELADAVAVCAARADVVAALGPLAARPLDEQAVERMRLAVARAGSPAVRSAVRRLSPAGALAAAPPAVALAPSAVDACDAGGALPGPGGGGA